MFMPPFNKSQLFSESIHGLKLNTLQKDASLRPILHTASEAGTAPLIVLYEEHEGNLDAMFLISWKGEEISTKLRT
jgi:hypothetical protein